MTAEEAHAIDQQTAICRIMDITFGDTAIHPQALPLRQVRLLGDAQDAIIQPLQGLGLNLALQVIQGAMVRDALVIHPHPPAIGLTIADFLFGLPVRPPLHPSQHGQPQDDFDRHRAPPVRPRSVMPSQISLHQGEELGII